MQLCLHTFDKSKNGSPESNSLTNDAYSCVPDRARYSPRTILPTSVFPTEPGGVWLTDFMLERYRDYQAAKPMLLRPGLVEPPDWTRVDSLHNHRRGLTN